MARTHSQTATAAAPGAHETRCFLPPNLKAVRLGMYRMAEREDRTHIPYAAAFANGAWPSDLEYEALYQTISNTPGCNWYTRKEHSNYRSRQRTRARATASAPATPGNLVTHNHSDNVLPVEERRSAHSSPAPRPADTLDATFADSLEPTSYADSSVVTDHHANSLDAMFTDILLALNSCSPDVHREICAAQNPTAEQLRHWAYISNVPAVAIFRLWDMVHPILE
ncbi:hypothetical protein TRAPUB_911 [Trametes pubescens]|uniref:Uncharacterized protein n=1 Tax=Trametes pubescens TaxID=154538 RepID=A0A1M2VKU8_TRAPU|nr:hypothetical protein TRAPUB_911 [Trametes pubescens]